MRIDDNGLANVNASPLQRSQQTGAADPSTGRPLQPQSGNGIQDQVSLSSLASSVRALQPDSAPREAFLAELAADFRAGRIESDPGEIAEALIEQALGEGELNP